MKGRERKQDKRKKKNAPMIGCLLILRQNETVDVAWLATQNSKALQSVAQRQFTNIQVDSLFPSQFN